MALEPCGNLFQLAPNVRIVSADIAGVVKNGIAKQDDVYHCAHLRVTSFGHARQRATSQQQGASEDNVVTGVPVIDRAPAWWRVRFQSFDGGVSLLFAANPSDFASTTRATASRLIVLLFQFERSESPLPKTRVSVFIIKCRKGVALILAPELRDLSDLRNPEIFVHPPRGLAEKITI